MSTYLIRTNRRVSMRGCSIHPYRLNAFLWAETLISLRQWHRRTLKSGLRVHQVLNNNSSQCRFWTSHTTCTSLRIKIRHHLKGAREKFLICRQIHHKSIDVGSDRKGRWNTTKSAITRTTLQQNKASTSDLLFHQESSHLSRDHYSRMAQTVSESWENRYNMTKIVKEGKVRFSPLSQNRSRLLKKLVEETPSKDQLLENN